MASIKDTLSVHTTEESILKAFKAVLMAEMQYTANEITQKAMQEMSNALQEKALEIISRAVIKVASEVNPMEREHRLHVSITLPMRY